MVSQLSLNPIGMSFSLKEHIYSVLRDAILELKIYDEDTDLRLDERKMADQLGISRTPIREALVRLEQEGFVDIQPRKGVFVRRKSLDEILEMITVWAALESMAARLATQHAKDAEIATLREFAAKYDREQASANISEYSEANIQFHQQILDLSKCVMLKQIADGLFLHMRAVRGRAMAESDRARRSVVDHMHIIEAIENRDADLAAEMVREHTMRLHAHVRRTWAEVAPAETGGGTKTDDVESIAS